MSALMQEVVERIHAIPEYRRDGVALKLLDVISEEESATEEQIVYVEIADDMTDEDRAEIAAARKEREEHPESSITIEDYMAEVGITDEELEKLPPVRLVWNIQ